MSKRRKSKNKNKKDKTVCPRCKGKREITEKEKLPNGGVRTTTRTCDLCYGSGKH